ncbi:MAG: low molecular weight phosphatase family protein [Phyllobacterium sp.]
MSEASGKPSAQSGKSGLPGSILFICGMNSIRSPMAELLARRVLPPSVYIASAGVQQGERDPFVDVVLTEEDLSLGDRHPVMLDDLEDNYFDLIITLAPMAHHRALELTRSSSVVVEYWPMPEPVLVGNRREQILQAYREVRDMLKARIEERFGPDSTL